MASEQGHTAGPLHRCTERECTYFGQPSAESCLCHKSAAQMIEEERDALLAALNRSRPDSTSTFVSDYIDQLEAHMDEGGKTGPQNVRDLIAMVRAAHDVVRRPAEESELKFELTAARYELQIADEVIEGLTARQSDLLDMMKRGRQKLATYTSVYPGDKELRGLLTDWDTAIEATA